jgi:D-serine dehydratase
VTDELVVDWPWKSFPPGAAGLPAARIPDAGWQLQRDFATPIAVLKESALAHNLARMRDYCAAHGVRHAPHGKTTMSPELIRRQLDHGVWGMTAATAWQARAMMGFGARRVLIANECVDPVGLRWIAERLRDEPDVEIYVFADSAAAVTAMCAVLDDIADARPLPVLVEVGAASGRAGVRGVPAAVAVGQAVAAAPELTLAGVAGFEGVTGASREPGTIDQVRAFLTDLRETGRALAAAAAFPADQPAIVSAGGSMFFDLVVEELSADYGHQVEVVLRSGCYLTHDHGLYRANSPLEAHPPDFQGALEVWTRVISTPEPNLAIVDTGRRDVGTDAGNPTVLLRSPAAHARLTGLAGTRIDPARMPTVRAFNDQHGFVHVPEPGMLQVGDLIALGISHPCTTLDKWRAIPVVDDDYRVVAAVRTYF